MCGRINLRASPAELQQMFDLFREPEWSPRYNLGPMQRMLAIRLQPEGTRLAEPLQWGLVPGWAKDPKIGSQMVNARGETVATKPSFRNAFKRRRCLIPVSGYYEWQVINSKTKQPWQTTTSDWPLLRDFRGFASNSAFPAMACRSSLVKHGQQLARRASSGSCAYRDAYNSGPKAVSALRISQSGLLEIVIAIR